MSSATIYTDGSCLSNPNGAGGWAGHIQYSTGEQETISGGLYSTTNNRAELLAVIYSLEHAGGQYRNIKVVSDSLLVVNCGKGVWRRKANTDLWAYLDTIIEIFDLNVSFKWVKGHSTCKKNNLVDEKARKEAYNIST